MKKNIDFFSNHIILPFIKAWNLFFEVQLPANRSYYGYTESKDSHVLCFIPVVGLVIGLIAYLFSSLVYFCTGTIVAAILCPFVILIFTEYLNHSRDSSNLVNFFTTKYAFYHKNPTEEKHQQQNQFMFYYVFIGIFILRILCFGTMIYFHRFGWLIVMFVLIFTLQGYLAIEGKYHLHREDLLCGGANSGIKLWVIAFVLCLFFGGMYLLSMLFAFVVAAFIGNRVKIALIRNNALNGTNIGIIGKIMEILLLLLGLLHSVHLN